MDYLCYALTQLQYSILKRNDAPASAVAHERSARLALQLERVPTIAEWNDSWREDMAHKADWSRFLRERHLLILEWRAEGQSFEKICSALSMDPVQVELISMTPLDDKKDRYDP